MTYPAFAVETFVTDLLPFWLILWAMWRFVAFIIRRPAGHASRLTFRLALVLALLETLFVLTRTVFWLVFDALIFFLALRGLLWLVVHGLARLRRGDPATPRWLPWLVGALSILLSLLTPVST